MSKSKKSFDTSSITNELRGSSAFFTRPAQNMEERPTPSSPRQVTSTLPQRRKTKRGSFEFFEDQLDLIKRLSEGTKQTDNFVSQSDIVRAALDDYLEALKE